MNHTLYAIWKNGEPIKGNEAMIGRNAFDQIRSVKGVLTRLVNEEASVMARQELGPDYYRYSTREKEEKFKAEIIKQYEIKEYMPK